jgi:CelD/BcsL family acetyltransferase involved in cellulose biosynthesis
MELREATALSPADLEAWRDLAARAAEPNPFFEELFVPAAVRALGATDVKLLVAARGGRWLGCLPLEFRRVLGRPVLAASWRHAYSFLGTPLVGGEDVEEFAADLARSLDRRERFRSLLLRDASAGPVLDAILAAVGSSSRTEMIFERRFERGAYEGRPQGEELPWLNSKRRSNLRRQRRQLDKQLGETRIVDHGAEEAAIAEFLRLESAGWKGRGGTALATDAGADRLFREICEGLAADGRLRLRALETADRTIAMSCEVAAGDVLFGFKSAYDEELAKYSPGLLLYAANFEAFDGEGTMRLFDSCAAPDNQAINSLWPERRALRTVAIGPRGPEGALLARMLERSYRQAAATA